MARLEEATGSKNVPGSVQDILSCQMERGEILPTNIDETKDTWHEMREDTDRNWDDMDPLSRRP